MLYIFYHKKKKKKNWLHPSSALCWLNDTSQVTKLWGALLLQCQWRQEYQGYNLHVIPKQDHICDLGKPFVHRKCVCNYKLLLLESCDSTWLLCRNM